VRAEPGTSIANGLRKGIGSGSVPVVVIIFPDGGERYLSESFWTEIDA
jgi:hypothetical protein